MDSSAIRKLLKLQEADMRLKDMETRLETLPKEMNNIIAKRDKIAANTAEAVTVVKKIKLRIKQDEDLIAELESSSEKLRQQSAMVKKNNEYQAMLGQIADRSQQDNGIFIIVFGCQSLCFIQDPLVFLLCLCCGAACLLPRAGARPL